MRFRFNRILCLALLLVFCVILTACGSKGGAGSEPQATVEQVPATPAPIHFSAGDVDPAAQTIRMALAPGETAMLDALPYLQSADLSGSAGEEEVAAWAAAHPNVQTRYTVTLPNGSVLDTDTQSVDLSGQSAADCEAAARKLALLPGLSSVNLGAEGGPLGWGDIANLRQILPKPAFKYAFKLYGTDCNLADTTINLYRVSVPDNGAFIDEVMGYMPQLTYVDMDSCGLQPKRLEEINLNHPNTKVVFRVYFGDNYTARTDAERILASMASRGGMLTNDNTEGLYYCHDVKYLDLGHNTLLTNIGFVAQMPKLEVAILSMCNFSDATPLASCPELEYLEMSNTYCTDLRPLSGLAKLRHLNVASIGFDQPYDGSPRIQLTDITPLYPLTELERLWIGAYNPVPPEQVQEMQRRAPKCEIDVEVYTDPVGGHWRYLDLANYIDTWVDTYHPRYVKLREQFGDYEYTVYNFTWNDPLCDPNYVPTSSAAAATPAPAAAQTPVPETVYVPDYQQSYTDYYADNSPAYDPYQESDELPSGVPYQQDAPQNTGEIVLNIPDQTMEQTETLPQTESEPQTQAELQNQTEPQNQTESHQEIIDDTQSSTVLSAEGNITEEHMGESFVIE